MDPAAHLDALRKRLARKNKEIAILEFARDYSRRVGDHWSHKSDTGWLTSIVCLTGGTLTAVLSGAEARRWRDQTDQIQERLAEARVDRHLLEVVLEGAGADDEE